MQFFEHQDQARGRTSLLVFLFVVAVVALVATSAVSTHLLLSWEVKPGEPLSDNHWSLVATAGIATFGVIFLGSAYRTAQLGGGGIKIAETLGGTLVTAQSHDLLERRLVNVVEEMSIAASLPVPPVFVMRNESGINAFAAGWSPDDAVIGVTRGALEALSRDQLQGVIAHEFSHILNRDCALNMRLIGVLHGIVLISVIGRILVRLGSSSDSGSGDGRRSSLPHFAILGLVVWICGSLGVFVARLIQAAVSRQREYLADASAVQFTRNPEGIAGALATIASQTSALASPRASEASHMLISEPGKGSLFSLDSHPPLFDRIQRVLPSWSGKFAALATPPGSVRAALSRPAKHGQTNVERAQELLLNLPVTALASEAPPSGIRPRSSKPTQQAGAGEATDPLVLQARRFLEQIPPAFRRAAIEPFSARALILAWILDADPNARSTQLALLGADPALEEETERLALLLPNLDSLAVLPLFDIALGTLAVLSDQQKKAFSSLVESAAAQLSRRSFRSYCLARLVLRHLAPEAAPRKVSPLLIKDAIETTLGILATEGHDGRDAATGAFEKGAHLLGKRGATLRLPGEESLTTEALDRALSTMLRLPTLTRATILDAAEAIAESDGVVRPSEAELLRTLATCLGVATPPAFATGG